VIEKEGEKEEKFQSLFFKASKFIAVRNKSFRYKKNPSGEDRKVQINLMINA